MSGWAMAAAGCGVRARTRAHIGDRASGSSPEPQVHPPFLYVWGLPDVPAHIQGLQPFSEELAAYLATHHHVTTYKFDNANPHIPYFVPVTSPLETLASVATASRQPPRVERQNARAF